jgi:hypothetical protein
VGPGFSFRFLDSLLRLIEPIILYREVNIMENQTTTNEQNFAERISTLKTKNQILENL